MNLRRITCRVPNQVGISWPAQRALRPIDREFARDMNVNVVINGTVVVDFVVR